MLSCLNQSTGGLTGTASIRMPRRIALPWVNCCVLCQLTELSIRLLTSPLAPPMPAMRQAPSQHSGEKSREAQSIR